MGLFRRREPLHEQLARQGGLQAQPLPDPGPREGAAGAPASWPGVAGSADDASSPRWMESGIHGVHRPREWDAVVTVEAEGVEGDRALFVALPDRTLLIEEGENLDALADALDGVVPPPYRAEAVRRGEAQWAVGIRRIQVIRLPDGPAGRELTLTVQDGSRVMVVDGETIFGSVPALEEIGVGRGDSYVVQGQRLDGDLWEVRVVPL